MGPQQMVTGNLFYKLVSKWSALDNNRLSPQAFWLSELEHRNWTHLHCGFGVTKHMPIGQGAAFILTHRNLMRFSRHCFSMQDTSKLGKWIIISESLAGHDSVLFSSRLLCSYFLCYYVHETKLTFFCSSSYKHLSRITRQHLSVETVSLFSGPMLKILLLGGLVQPHMRLCVQSYHNWFCPVLLILLGSLLFYEGKQKSGGSWEEGRWGPGTEGMERRHVVGM